MDLAEGQAAAGPEVPRGDSPAEGPRNEVGPSPLGLTCQGEIPKPCQGSLECSQPGAEAPTTEKGKETPERGGPSSAVET